MEYALEMIGIRKTFPGVVALDGVNLMVERGEVHGLVGENGAGKSTLIKILSGVYEADAGTIKIFGHTVSIRGPHDAKALKIAVVHQERKMVSELTVSENLWLGHRFPRKFLGIVDWAAIHARSKEIFDELGIDIEPDRPVKELSLAQQQLVDIAKAMLMHAQVVIFDEPTTALTPREVEIIFRLIKRLRNSGISIIYISHHLEEVLEITQRVTVLRDGRVAGNVSTNQTTIPEIIRLMVGRDLREQYPSRTDAVKREELLLVRGLSRQGVLHDVSFSVHRGEIVAIAGLAGSGRTELAQTLFGIDKADRGEVYIDGRIEQISSVRSAIHCGLGLVPEDRKKQGLVLGASIRKNITLGNEHKFRSLGFINRTREAVKVNEYVQKLGIRTPGVEQEVGLLSGGNQQKVVLAKWLCFNSKVYILDEPTVGVDVGAKAEIYTLMNKLAGDGAAILMISSDLREVLGMSDRILVMKGGRIVGELKRGVTQEDVMSLATEGHSNAS